MEVTEVGEGNGFHKRSNEDNEGRAMQPPGPAFGRPGGGDGTHRYKRRQARVRALVSAGTVASQPREARPGGNPRAFRVIRVIRGYLLRSSPFASLLRF